MKNQHKELVDKLQHHTKWLKAYFNHYKNSPTITYPIIEDFKLAIIEDLKLAIDILKGEKNNDSR